MTMKPLIRFAVLGLPPKKDGANSMWRKSTERERLKRLRSAAVESMQGRQLLTKPIHLIVRLYAEPHDGDLDNFITGICDGLMAVQQRTPIAMQEWDDIAPAAAPIHPIVYRDDKLIARITAERMPPIDGTKRYEIEIMMIDDLTG